MAIRGAKARGERQIVLPVYSLDDGSGGTKAFSRYENLDLKGVRFVTPLTSAVFENCKFTYVYFRNKVIRNTQFKNCTFVHCYFTKLQIEDTRFDGSRADSTKIIKCSIHASSFVYGMEKIDCRYRNDGSRSLGLPRKPREDMPHGHSVQGGKFSPR